MNWGELRKNWAELSVSVPTSHRNAPGRLRKAGGADKIAPDHAGNGAGNAEKPGASRHFRGAARFAAGAGSIRQSCERLPQGQVVVSVQE
jgi:hypothetical protein